MFKTDQVLQYSLSLPLNISNLKMLTTRRQTCGTSKKWRLQQWRSRKENVVNPAGLQKSGSTTIVLRKCLLLTEGMRNSKMIGLWRYRQWKTVKYDYHPFALRVHKDLHHHAEGAVSTLDDRCLEQMSRWTWWWDCVGKR